MLQLTTIVFLIAFSTLAVIHSIAIELFLYWHIWWFDMPMHFLGGAVVALGFFTLRDLQIFPNNLLKPVPILLFVLLIAVIWEAFELIVGIPVEDNYGLDTAIDIVMGITGGVIGYLVGNSLRSLR